MHFWKLLDSFELSLARLETENLSAIKSAAPADLQSLFDYRMQIESMDHSIAVLPSSENFEDYRSYLENLSHYASGKFNSDTEVALLSLSKLGARYKQALASYYYSTDNFEEALRIVNDLDSSSDPEPDVKWCAQYLRVLIEIVQKLEFAGAWQKIEDLNRELNRARLFQFRPLSRFVRLKNIY